MAFAAPAWLIEVACSTLRVESESGGEGERRGDIKVTVCHMQAGAQYT